MRRLLLLAAGLLLAACDDGGGGGEGYPFEDFAWLAAAPDARNDRLCTEAADPSAAADKIFIDCRIEGERFAPHDRPPETEPPLVMAYNLERGFEVDAMIEAMRDGSVLPRPDVLLVSEVDRGCARTDHRHVARDLAQALQMNYLYAVEFVELDWSDGPDSTLLAACEHGNAILSRYPLGNARAIRHAEQEPWYYRGESRLGGRVAMAADAWIGDGFVHLYAVHYESNVGEQPRDAQAVETAEDALARPHPAIVGGDLNSGFYVVDLMSGTDSDRTVKPFLERGFVDAHADLELPDRVTAPHSGFILDLVLGLRAGFSKPGVCPDSDCGSLSDHLPVWVDLVLER